MKQCDYIGYSSQATKEGYIYGHATGSSDKDSLFEVSACDKHSKMDGFFEKDTDKE